MRILCSFVGGAGHLVPQMPLHRALAAAGHDLTVTGRASTLAGMQAGIYRRLVAQPDHRTEPSRDIAPLTPVDVMHEIGRVEAYFAGPRAVQSAAWIEDEIGDADLLVCDEMDLGAMAIAQRSGIPAVAVAVISSGALVRPELLTTSLSRLAEQLHVPEPIRPRGDVFIVPFAPSMRDPRFPDPVDTWWMRPDGASPPEPDGSIVATLGTEFNTESGDLFNRILVALGDSARPSILAIGRDLEPSRFAAVPPNVRIEQYVDLTQLIPRASAVLHHGGSGLFVQSVLGGAPQVLLPMGADQPLTAQTVERLGIGRVLDPLTTTAEQICSALETVADDGPLRDRILRLREECSALPTPESIARRVEGLRRAVEGA